MTREGKEKGVAKNRSGVQNDLTLKWTCWDFKTDLGSESGILEKERR